MAVQRTIEATAEEIDAAATAIDYYLETLTKCAMWHDGEGHGDETACEGWGPEGYANLDSFYRKLLRTR